MTTLTGMLPPQAGRRSPGAHWALTHSWEASAQARGWGLSNCHGGVGLGWARVPGMQGERECPLFKGMGDREFTVCTEVCQSNLAAKAVPGLMASTTSPPSGAKLHPSPLPTSGRSVPGAGPWSLRGTHRAFFLLGEGALGRAESTGPAIRIW